MDTVDRRTRSRIMASVGQRNTGPERRLRYTLHRLGLRYRLQDRDLPGTPDIVFPRFRAVLFVHGCFWHSHVSCRFATKPSSREIFWREKFKANRKRDKRNYKTLAQRGFRVLVVWECAIKGQGDEELNRLGTFIKGWLKSRNEFREIGRNHHTLCNRKKAVTNCKNKLADRGTIV